MRDFRCPRGKIHVVHDGVDKRFFEGAEKEFFGEYGLKDFVLYVGRIEPRKNVLNLIKAIKGTNLELVVVGDYDRETPRYYEKCKAAANESVHFLGRIEHESKLLVSAYYAAKVLALPSWYETPGIVALEAGAAGCNIVITDRGCTKEYFSDFAEYVAPDDLNGIRTAILRACKKSRNNALRERIRKNYSWENVADEIIAGYLKITGN
jgi:glycosyltransferase involved in cell wall biosynthesis